LLKQSLGETRVSLERFERFLRLEEHPALMENQTLSTGLRVYTPPVIAAKPVPSRPRSKAAWAQNDADHAEESVVSLMGAERVAEDHELSVATRRFADRK
jgi:hypothetical protein